MALTLEVTASKVGYQRITVYMLSLNVTASKVGYQRITACMLPFNVTASKVGYQSKKWFAAYPNHIWFAANRRQ